MCIKDILKVSATAAALLLVLATQYPSPAFSQEQVAAADASDAAATSPEPLSPDELEVLVARIALYPDELIAVITAAALYPLQIVEAARFLDQYAKDKSLKPKESWDGSVISLLNYPDIVKMMSDDLDWTQALGDAIAYQQKDRAGRHPAAARRGGGQGSDQDRRKDRRSSRRTTTWSSSRRTRR